MSYKRIIAFFLFILSAHSVLGQQDIEMADQFRAEGKIYIVLAVIGIILLGLLAYLVAIDRKVSKLEKQKRP